MGTMTLDDYQLAALKTAVYPNSENDIAYPALGLTGEAGEVADKIKKILRDQAGEMTAKDREEIMKELGDVLWYVGILGHRLGYTLDTIAQANIDKLKSRKARGVLGGSGDNR